MNPSRDLRKKALEQDQKEKCAPGKGENPGRIREVEMTFFIFLLVFIM